MTRLLTRDEIDYLTNVLGVRAVVLPEVSAAPDLPLPSDMPMPSDAPLPSEVSVTSSASDDSGLDIVASASGAALTNPVGFEVFGAADALFAFVIMDSLDQTKSQLLKRMAKALALPAVAVIRIRAIETVGQQLSNWLEIHPKRQMVLFGEKGFEYLTGEKLETHAVNGYRDWCGVNTLITYPLDQLLGSDKDQDLVKRKRSLWMELKRMVNDL